MAQTTFREHIQSIEDAISAGQIDEAMSRCQQILAPFPDSLEIQRLLGEVYLAQGRLDEAQQTFDWILVNDPENVIAYCDRALICEHLADIETALDCYQQAYELSRGNSQIRQEFNQLSAKAGLQEFMLSRAGLARLYTRGDLLTQAIQEWEAVLSTTPDRLDARLGLMEACWREGLNDQVEQLASRIIEEIPNCEKGLLLLAHVTSPFNISRARELLQRAELLDPELVMAQELFGDLIANQPNDPFLSMIKRESIILDQQTNGNGKHLEAINTFQYPAVDVKELAMAKEASADRLYNWNVQDSLSELDTGMMAQSNTPSTQEARDRATWLDDSNFQKVDTLDNQPAQQQPVDDFDEWASQQEIDDDYDPTLLEQRPWFQAEQTAAHSNEPASNDSQPVQAVAVDSWSTPTPSRQEEVPAPPAWLDMLTKNERNQPAETIHTTEPQESSSEEAVPTPTRSWEDILQPVPTPVVEEAPSPFFFASDDKEEDMGWPEWLKSLGAETIKPEPEPEPIPEPQPVYNAWTDLQQSASSVKPGNARLDDRPDQPPVKPAAQQSQPPETTSYNLWAIKPEEPSSQFTTWEQQIDQTMSESEREHLATLETLEQSLRSKGFVPLQPGSLSTIASETNLTAAPVPSNKTEAAPESRINPVPPETAAPPPLPVPPVARSVWDAWSEAGAQASAYEQPVEANDVPTDAAIPAERTQQETRTPALATNRGEQVAPETPPAVAYRPDALLENELETTMRRPAIRLQPIKTAVRSDQASSAAKGRAISSADRGRSSSGSGTLTNKEQLVKGYQYQLVGSYDDAMQEYRITIRNAPELLEVVISNLRALLKIAPKYTAGYRVLGDAYMRQGEYLQAMEAYNKALTIAKKAKSQVH